MRLKLLYIFIFLCVLCCSKATAQHTFGVVMGYGVASGRFEPTQETRSITGRYSGGVSWRHYTDQRYLGCFGIDLEFLQQGYSFATNTSFVEEEKDYLYYTRRLNTIVMPIVWQPHFYMINNRVRVYLELSATFSYNMGSTYENEALVDNETVVNDEMVVTKETVARKGDYNFKSVRDNRFGYGLAGGGGVAILFNQFELNFRARYYFGLSDVLKNRNKYSGNVTDDPIENPFYGTPLRSPLDNINISVGLSYRFNKSGFDAWNVKREKRAKTTTEFNYNAEK